MKWKKKGRIFFVSGQHELATSHALLPTPFLLENGNIRMYFTSMDERRIGRTFYIDLNSDNPSEILQNIRMVPVAIEESPDFDGYGINTCQVIMKDSVFLLYYIGYSRPSGLPYKINPGLLVSRSPNFLDAQRYPILKDEMMQKNLSHGSYCVFQSNDALFMWYANGEEWISVNGKPYLQTTIKSGTSTDGIAWTMSDTVCITPQANEFAIGRPWVIMENNLFKMWYSIRSKSVPYRIGYAESVDGINWTRKDEEVGIDVSASGWDSEMICYPSVIKVKDRTYLFYNGNNNGETGFGWAELVK